MENKQGGMHGANTILKSAPPARSDLNNVILIPNFKVKQHAQSQ